MMASFVKPESIDSRKRKFENECVGNSKDSSMTSENEPSTSSEDQAKKRKSFLRSGSSKEWVVASTEEDEDETDRSYSESKLTDGEEGNFPASKWQYVDLKNIKIFYCAKPDTFENFVEDVKSDILEKYPSCPDFSKIVKKFTNLTQENLIFSYDLEAIRQTQKNLYEDKLLLEKKIFKEVESNKAKAEEAERKLDHSNLFNRKWFPAVEKFLHKTCLLIKKVLYPRTDDETVKEAKELLRKRKAGKKTCKGKKQKEKVEEKHEADEMFYQHFCSMFGNVFFLEPDEVNKRTFVIADKIVNSTPDLAYSLSRMPDAGYSSGSTLLFVIEVKKNPVKNVLSGCLEDQVGSGVLGQVGSELFAEAYFSVLNPNSLGIICMETKLIFVYLKMPEEHLSSIRFKQPLETEGKIHYTQPFDILKAEDRTKVAEFLYWLGCVQNHGRSLL